MEEWLSRNYLPTIIFVCDFVCTDCLLYFSISCFKPRITLYMVCSNLSKHCLVWEHGNPLSGAWTWAANPSDKHWCVQRHNANTHTRTPQVWHNIYLVFLIVTFTDRYKMLDFLLQVTDRYLLEHSIVNYNSLRWINIVRGGITSGICS